MQLLKVVMSSYSKAQQKAIRNFMKTNGLHYPEEEIKMLIRDLEQVVNKEVLKIVRKGCSKAAVA